MHAAIRIHLLTLTTVLLHSTTWSQSPPRATTPKTTPEAVTVDIKDFQPATTEEKTQVEKWLLDIELLPLMADRVAFTATGTIYMAGTSKKSQTPNYCHFAIGWCLDNAQDRERLMVVNQSLLKPFIVEDDKWRLMQADSAEVDSLRVKSTYHERNGSVAYEPGPKTKVRSALKGSNTFFPTRAVVDNPVSAWNGQALDRSKPTVKIEQLIGFQKVGKHSVALFEFVPADFYRYYRAISFLDGAPVQCDDWRQFRQVDDMQNKSPTREQIEDERSRLIKRALHVARVQSKWKKVGEQLVPTWIHGVTMNDFHDVQLEAEIEWFVNDQVNADSFLPESLGQLGPFQLGSR